MNKRFFAIAALISVSVFGIGLLGLPKATTHASDLDSRDIEIEVGSASAAAANNQSLAAVAGRTTYITGFSVTGAGATGASVIAVTITGLSNTLTYYVAIPAGAGVGITPLIIEFSRPIPASAVNTAIGVNVPSFGAGNTQAAATARGFQR